MWTSFALISALFSAGAAIGEKKSLQKEDAISFSVVLGLLNLILSIPFIFFINSQDLHSTVLIILFIKSLMGAISFVCVMEALKRMDISATLPLMVLTPGFVAVIAWLFIGESLTLRQISGLVILLAGTWALQSQLTFKWKIVQKETRNHPGYFFIGIALMLFTLTSIMDKVLVGQYKMSPEGFIFFQHLFLFINLFVLSLFYYRKKSVTILSSTVKQSIFLILLIAFLTIGYRYTQILAVKGGPVALVIALKRLSVLLAAGVGGKLFKDKNLLQHLIAACLMVLGALLIVLQ